MQKHDAAAAQVPGELAGDADLFIGVLLPRAGALRISEQSRERLAERAEVCAGALLALRASALVLTDRASADPPSTPDVCLGDLELTWLDVVGVDIGLADGWLSVVHGDRERFVGVHGDLGCLPVAVPDPVGVVGW